MNIPTAAEILKKREDKNTERKLAWLRKQEETMEALINHLLEDDDLEYVSFHGILLTEVYNQLDKLGYKIKIRTDEGSGFDYADISLR